MSTLLVIYKGNSNWKACSDILGSVLKGGKTSIIQDDDNEADLNSETLYDRT